MKGNPRTPLRSLLVEETEEDCEAYSITRSTPGVNPCVKHLHRSNITPFSLEGILHCRQIRSLLKN